MTLKQKILDATRQGLDIFLDLYPESAACLNNKKAKFKVRDEATPSAHIVKFTPQGGDDQWYLKDFGAAGKALDCIQAYAEYHKMNADTNWKEVCDRICKEYNIADTLNRDVNKPDFVKRQAKQEEEEGQTYFELSQDFTDAQLKIFGPLVTADVLKSMHWYVAIWIGTVKNRMITEKHTTPTYPIFVRECLVKKGDQEEVFYKKYEVYNVEKKYRFSYFPSGKKPQDYLNGLTELYQEFYRMRDKAREDWDLTHDENHPFDENHYKMPEAILCSGERDAACVRARGYMPLWKNSETADLDEYQYRELHQMIETLYNIPDIDSTGITMGTKLALQYPEIYTIWLPDWLSLRRDNRGKPMKDFRDWCSVKPKLSAFKDLIKGGKPAQFWIDKVDTKGNITHYISSEYLFHFLRLNGYYILKDENADDPRFIHIKNNIVESIQPQEIRNFVVRWANNDTGNEHGVTQRHGVREAILDTPKLEPAKLKSMEQVDISFDSADSKTQRFYFPNGTATVSADEIHFVPINQINTESYVWKENVLKFSYRKLDQMFEITITTNDQGQPNFDIQIKNPYVCQFFGFLINSSRLYWRKEMEDGFANIDERKEYASTHQFCIDGDGLAPEEIQEQKQTLINKIFAVGYILHQYKSPSRAWALYAMDNKVDEDDKCNGRSGKSFFVFAISQLRKTIKLSGRDPKQFDNPHVFDSVDQYTQILQIDDLSKSLQASRFYDIITGDLTVNPKNNRIFTIKFDQSPKLAMTTNYVPGDFDPSTTARLLPMIFSDYYHERTDTNGYLESRSVRDDFQMDLFTSSYSEQNWNAFYNFVMQCEQFYLRMFKEFPNVKIMPPMGNIMTRKLLQEMGPQFKDWASLYFMDEGPHVNTQIIRTDAWTAYKESTGSLESMKTFTRRLYAFVKWCPWIYELNPAPEYRNSQGRNVKNIVDECGVAKTVEFIYLRTVKEHTKKVNDRSFFDDKPF
ncbi:hypothetical protein [Segatella bryantii]|jgi:hypothetical protein|uniref:hypothetical protein n=1 Tax=Segatella bryantii TaxID=77095 RepID=UPI00089170A1|nr:hypothetical protein [Segatella bryantii]SDM08185.1 hypothetical protein SAMN04487899_11828 [Segatella bryantii]